MISEQQTSNAAFMVTRQPVFDRGLQPWGTAMCFPRPQADDLLYSDETTANMLLEAYLPQRGPTHARTIVFFPAQAILENMPRLLWPQGIVVEIDEAAAAVAGVPQAVAQLKQAGYGIAVSGFRNSSAARDLNAQADIIISDQRADGTHPSLEERILASHEFGAKALIRGLDSWTPMLQARAVNEDMFQGYFFNDMNLKPSQKSVTATQLSRMRLLECLDKPDADFKALARLVEMDAALTYRLLLFLNSASFGLARQVTSIQQAVVMAGWKPLKKWLEVVLLTDLSPTPRHQELCYYAAQRAGFLKRCAQASGREQLMPRLSLLGLLSYIEAILEMPPAQALAEIPLDGEIRMALCGQPSSLAVWLTMVRSMETADWLLAGELAASIGLTLADLSRCYLDSLTETDTMFRLLPAPQQSVRKL